MGTHVEWWYFSIATFAQVKDQNTFTTSWLLHFFHSILRPCLVEGPCAKNLIKELYYLFWDCAQMVHIPKFAFNHSIRVFYLNKSSNTHFIISFQRWYCTIVVHIPKQEAN